jgi:hypothetical protein
MTTSMTLLVSVVLKGLTIGFSRTKDKENTFSAAGLKIEPADTPEKETRVKSLPADKSIPVQFKQESDSI